MSTSKQYRLLRKAAAEGVLRFDPFLVLGLSSAIKLSPEDVAAAVESRCVLLVSQGGLDDEETSTLKNVIAKAGELLSNPITLQSCLQVATSIPQQSTSRKGKRCIVEDNEYQILNKFEDIIKGTNSKREGNELEEPSLEKQNRKSRQAARKRQVKAHQALQLERKADQLLYGDNGRNSTPKMSPKTNTLKQSFRKASWGTQKELPPGTVFGPHGLGGTAVLRYTTIVASTTGLLFHDQPLTQITVQNPLEKSGGKQKLTTTDLTAIGVIEDLGLGAFEGGQTRVLNASGLKRKSSRGVKTEEAEPQPITISSYVAHPLRVSQPVAIPSDGDTPTSASQSFTAFSVGSVSTTKTVSPLGYQMLHPVSGFPESPLNTPLGSELAAKESNSDMSHSTSSKQSDDQSIDDSDLLDIAGNELILLPPRTPPSKKLSVKVTLKDTSVSQFLLWTLLPISVASLVTRRPFSLNLKGACDTGELPFLGVECGIGSLMKLFGLDVGFDIIKRRGHQKDEVRLNSNIKQETLHPVSLTTPGSIKSITITVWVSKSVSVDSGQKAARAASQALFASLQHTFSGTSPENLVSITETHLCKEDSVEGSTLSVFVSINSTLGGTWCGWSIGKGTKAELTGERAASRTVSDICKGGCISEYLQDHAAILLALSASSSLSTTRIRISPASKNLNTVIPILQNILPVKFSFVSAGRTDFGLTCKPGVVMQCEPYCDEDTLVGVSTLQQSAATQM